MRQSEQPFPFQQQRRRILDGSPPPLPQRPFSASLSNPSPQPRLVRLESSGAKLAVELDERRRELESFAREQLAHGLVLFVGVVFGERGQEALQVAHVRLAERLPRPLGEALLEEARVPA